MSSRAVLDVSRLPPASINSRALVWWGMCGLIAIEATMVALFIGTYLYLRFRVIEWPPPGAFDRGLGLPTLSALVLVLSAIPMYLADKATKEDDRGRIVVMTVANILLALVFLGLRWPEMKRLPYDWHSHAYGSIVWALYALNTVHVTGSVAESIYLVLLIVLGHLHDEQRLALRTDGIYWYFVVVTWLMMYGLIYVFPRLP